MSSWAGDRWALAYVGGDRLNRFVVAEWWVEPVFVSILLGDGEGLEEHACGCGKGSMISRDGFARVVRVWFVAELFEQVVFG